MPFLRLNTHDKFFIDLEVLCFTRSCMGSSSCGTCVKNLYKLSEFKESVCVSVAAVTVAVRIVEENKAISPKKAPCVSVVNFELFVRSAS